eukprot:5179456-Amphidinium_carterae.2
MQSLLVFISTGAETDPIKHPSKMWAVKKEPDPTFWPTLEMIQDSLHERVEHCRGYVDVLAVAVTLEQLRDVTFREVQL